MEIDKAINLLSYLSETKCVALSPVEWDALKLGIEALKREKHNRLSFPKVPIRLLPEETKE